MIRTFTFLIQYNLINFYNGLIFYLQKIPVLGKFVSTKLYQANFVFQWGVPLAIIYQLMSAIFSNIVFIVIIGILLPSYGNKFVDSEQILFSKYGPYYLTIAMLIVGMSFEIFRAFENNETKYMHIKILRVNPRLYAFVNDLLIYGPKIIGFSVAMSLFQFILKISFYEAFSFVIFVTGLRLFMRSLYLYLFKNNYHLGEKLASYLSFSVAGVGFILGVLGTFLNLGFDYHLFFSLKFLVLGLFLLLLTIIFNIKTRYLEQFIFKSLNMSHLIETKQTIAEANTQSAQVKDNQIRLTTTHYSNDKGIIYINKLFYDRINSVFKKKILFRVGIIGVTIIAFNALKYFDLFSQKDVRGLSQFIPLIAILIARGLYLGEFFTRTSFYYMDRKLLKFPFYRTKKNITDSIIFRIKQLLKYNSPQFIVLLIGLLFTYYHWDIFDPKQVLLMIISLISGYIFMTFHFLFAYYMFQPFTNQMTIKNPFYTGILTFFNYNLYFGMIALLSYAEYLVFGFFAFVILYVVLGTYTVHVFGTKRFKLR